MGTSFRPEPVELSTASRLKISIATMDNVEITEPVTGKRPSQRWRVSAKVVVPIAVVLIMVALSTTLVRPERRRVIRYPVLSKNLADL